MKNPFVPLAERIRPTTLSEFIGQKHLVGKKGIIRQLIESDQVPSMILWGPPGTGKTTLAHIIANVTKSHFFHYSAVTATLDDVRKVVAEAKERLAAYTQKTILFLDEIHRFNKAQQDAFLPYVEKGTITLIGATTENPSFEVIGPLLSRCRVFVFYQLNHKELRKIIKRGLNFLNKGITEEALGFLIQSSGGDARIALNAIEIAAGITNLNSRQKHKHISANPKISLQLIKEVLQKKPLLYDRAGEEHYNTISAFIKSMRGSDPDAALYYLARMLEAGEDPLFIARRMVIFASEDIGNADPRALPLAIAVFEACERIGLPECELNLAQGATYLATAPKSNASTTALIAVKKDVKRALNEPIPLHLRNPVTPLMKKVGYGKGYKYPHSFKDHWVKEEYLPGKLKGRRYYHPSEQGEESQIKKRIERWRKQKEGRL